jgi:hypothetical protein
MGKTFDQSLIDTARISMSMIDPEDMEDTSSEEFASMRRIQNGCHTELSNRDDFPFNKFTKTIRVNEGQNSYTMVEGKIKSVYLNNSELKYLADFKNLSDATGKPKYYTVQTNPEKIKLYPTPDDSYSIDVEYFSTKNVKLTNDEYSYTIEIGSTLRMPERFQHLYFDALEYRVLAENLRKISNARYEPTLQLFNEKWLVFLRGCKTVDTETVFTI